MENIYTAEQFPGKTLFEGGSHWRSTIKISFLKIPIKSLKNTSRYSRACNANVFRHTFQQIYFKEKIYWRFFGGCFKTIFSYTFLYNKESILTLRHSVLEQLPYWNQGLVVWRKNQLTDFQNSDWRTRFQKFPSFHCTNNEILNGKLHFLCSVPASLREFTSIRFARVVFKSTWNRVSY